MHCLHNVTVDNWKDIDWKGDCMMDKICVDCLGLRNSDWFFEDQVVDDYWWRSSGTDTEACVLYWLNQQVMEWGGMNLCQDSGLHKSGDEAGDCGSGSCQWRLGAGLPVRGTSTGCGEGLSETSGNSKKANAKLCIRGVKLQWNRRVSDSGHLWKGIWESQWTNSVWVRGVEASCIRMSVASRSSKVIISCCSALGRSHLSTVQFWDSVAQKRHRQFGASLAENH